MDSMYTAVFLLCFISPINDWGGDRDTGPTCVALSVRNVETEAQCDSWIAETKKQVQTPEEQAKIRQMVEGPWKIKARCERPVLDEVLPCLDCPTEAEQAERGDETMSELNEWEQAVRSNNEPGLPNVILTLDEAKKWIEANPDEFNTCFVIFHKKNLEHGAGPDFDVSWHNAGLRYSELLGIFAYLTNYMCAEMGGRSH